MSSSESGRSRTSRREEMDERSEMRKDKKDKKDGKDKKKTSMDEKLDAIMTMGVQTNQKVGMLSNNVTTCLTEIGSIKNGSAAFQEQTAKNFEDVNGELTKQAKLIADLQSSQAELRAAQAAAGSGAGGGAAAGRGAGEGGDRGEGVDEPFVPIGKRKVVFVGGFPDDAEREDIEKKLGSMTEGATGVADVYATRKIGGNGKIKFQNSDHMWKLLKSKKGVKFDFQGTRIFFTIDKTLDEIKMSNKVGNGFKFLKAHLESTGTSEEDIGKRLMGEYNLGIVYYKTSLTSKFKVIFHRKRGEKVLSVEPGAEIEGLDVEAALATINAERE